MLFCGCLADHGKRLKGHSSCLMPSMHDNKKRRVCKPMHNDTDQPPSSLQGCVWTGMQGSGENKVIKCTGICGVRVPRLQQHHKDVVQASQACVVAVLQAFGGQHDGYDLRARAVIDAGPAQSSGSPHAGHAATRYVASQRVRWQQLCARLIQAGEVERRQRLKCMLWDHGTPIARRTQA